MKSILCALFPDEQVVRMSPRPVDCWSSPQWAVGPINEWLGYCSAVFAECALVYLHKILNFCCPHPHGLILGSGPQPDAIRLVSLPTGSGRPALAWMGSIVLTPTRR